MKVTINGFSNRHSHLGFSPYLRLQFDVEFPEGTAKDNELYVSCLDAGLRFVRSFKFAKTSHQLLEDEVRVSSTNYDAVHDFVIAFARQHVPATYEKDVIAWRKAAHEFNIAQVPEWNQVEFVQTPSVHNLQLNQEN